MRGVITSVGFESGDRFVIGDWKRGPIGPMTDIMWARPDGERVLLAPSCEVADFVSAIYAFDRVWVVPFTVSSRPGALRVAAGTVRIGVDGGPPIPIPGPRPSWVTRYVEQPIARVLLGVSTYGVSPTGVEEWYRALALRWVTDARAWLFGKDLGAMTEVDPPVGVGFTEPPRRPSMVTVWPLLRRP